MKKQKISGYSLAIAAAILLSSCGTSRISDFSSRKYTDFERGSVSGFSPTPVLSGAEGWEPGSMEENRKELYANAETRYTNFNYENLKTSDYYETVLTRTVENDPPVIRKEWKGLLRACNAKVHVEKTDLSGNSILFPFKKNDFTTTPGSKTQVDPEPEFLIELIFAFLLPPVAVYLHTDEIGTLFWISLLLTFFFWVPGVIFAILVIGDLIK